MRKIAILFSTAFILNLVWENAHSLLYAHNMGGPITEPILLYATLVDAIIITIIVSPFIYSSSLKKYDWLIPVIGVVIAIIIEKRALPIGKWAYNSLMPIIPFLGIGLTPTIQLAFLGYVSYKIAIRQYL